MVDPMDNGLFDLPDYDNTEDERFAAFPPPASPGAEPGGGHEANGMEDWDGNQRSPQAEEPSKPVRKTVKRNLPRLDAQRLTSERGLPALRTMFDKAKFKGKGHEAEDVKLLLRQMEHWAHRLYPKLGFEDFITKLEILGTKKPVQVCLKRIRMDMPILHDDFTTPKGEEPEGQSNGLNMPTDDFEMNHPPEDSEPLSDSWSRIVASPPPSQSSSFLNEEQRLRIERNKQLALERRMAKIQSSSQTQDVSPPATPVSTFVEVKKTDPQDMDELCDDMDVEFLDALVAAAAESEAAVLGEGSSSTTVSNTVNIVAADGDATVEENIASDLSDKEVAETALAEDDPVIAAPKTPAGDVTDLSVGEAAIAMETSEPTGASVTNAALDTDEAAVDVEAAVNNASANLGTPGSATEAALNESAADTETFAAGDADASPAKAVADVVEDAKDVSVNSTPDRVTSAEAAMKDAAVSMVSAGEAAASDAVGTSCAVDTITSEESVRAPADRNSAPGDSGADVIAVSGIPENLPHNGDKGKSLENTH